MNGGAVLKFGGLPTAYALRLKESVGPDEFPVAGWWEKAPAIRFERDWRGAQSDPQRATEVRLLWNEQTLYLLFVAHYARVYKELEVSPNGFWIDLNIAHGTKEEMRSGLRRRVIQEPAEQTWTAELAVPMGSLTPEFDPKQSWRANFFRVEGKIEPRFYSAWSPTLTPKPNFHVPEAFGHLVFRES
jgi:alpha-galactosidase